MLTERDYLRKVALKGRSSKTTQVDEIMSSPVVCAHSDDTIKQCMSVMTEKRCRHLPVVDARKTGRRGLDRRPGQTDHQGPEGGQSPAERLHFRQIPGLTTRASDRGDRLESVTRCSHEHRNDRSAVSGNLRGYRRFPDPRSGRTGAYRDRTGFDSADPPGRVEAARAWTPATSVTCW